MRAGGARRRARRPGLSSAVLSLVSARWLPPTRSLVSATPWLLAAAASLAGACLPSLSGRRDVGRPSIEAAPRAGVPLQQACGRLHVARPARLLRPPYLQDVTGESAALSWASRRGLPERAHFYPAEGLGSERAARVQSSERPGAARAWRRVARLRGLRPSQTYCYELRDEGHDLVYGPVAFRTAPEPDAPGPISALILGDSGGGGADQRAVRDAMLRVPSDLMIHAGDLAYPAATVRSYDRVVFGMYRELLRSIPIFPVLGNHDVRGDGGQVYLDAFVLPEDGHRERWYTVRWGPIRLLMIDTEADLSRQARWLDEELARTEAPWPIVVGHRPPFSSGQHGSDRRVRSSISPVLVRHRVPLMLSGHDHHYERTAPIDGVTYVVTGAGGHSTRPVWPRPFTAQADSVLHFVHLSATREQLVLRAVDTRGGVFDLHRIDRRGAGGSPP